MDQDALAPVRPRSFRQTRDRPRDARKNPLLVRRAKKRELSRYLAYRRTFKRLDKVPEGDDECSPPPEPAAGGDWSVVPGAAAASRSDEEGRLRRYLRQFREWIAAALA